MLAWYDMEVMAYTLVSHENVIVQESRCSDGLFEDRFTRLILLFFGKLYDENYSGQ